MNLPLNTAFTESHRFWVVVFSFSFVSMNILICFLISSVICWLFRSMLFSLHMFIFLIVFHVQFSSVQSLSHVWLFVTPWITARQASLSITNIRSSPKLMCIELVMPSSHLILCRPLLLMPSIFPASGSFPMSQLFAWGGQSIGVSTSASVLSMNAQDWSPLGWTGWIFLQSKGFSRVLSNTTVQKHRFFCAQLSSQSNSHIHTWPLEKPKPWLDGPLLAK